MCVSVCVTDDMASNVTTHVGKPSPAHASKVKSGETYKEMDRKWGREGGWGEKGICEK